MTNPARARTNLLRWFRRAKRDLPWRRSRDPYAIWVSEMMLQQTTVAAVIPYYERFMRQFPTISALAASDEDSVLALWSGLGYYSRARNLRTGAQAVTKNHAGRFPADMESAMSLKGVGRYTASAVTSMAYGMPAAAVDGNVRRVVSRLFAEKSLNDARAQVLATSLLSLRSPGAWNEAMMELGATVCTPKTPRCEVCPISADCAGRSAPEYWSEGKPRRAAIPTRVDLVFVESGGRLLLKRNPEGALMGGLLDLPNTGIPGTPKIDRSLTDLFGRDLRIDSGIAAAVRHTVTHHRIEAHVRTGSLVRSGRSAIGDFYAVREITSLPLGGLTRKALRALGVLRI